ncbi:helix-turn-helix domain-containing protein [Actinokineospora bangkokensis]|uniref:HTH cro/C1-type domain-containing protein n=1 Tax=Actinokineospora bangkokensis TaxID=1193682 RepID=A0A1Q9LLU6_9PSEU|nr:helix-turn-helix transcriptional regulator [Actinokineospora bangkokensis]OLR92991.1 hypothetical protein BJP25_18685 [Actinokineospora bangkokensis]
MGDLKDDAREIGARARRIRVRRGLSLEVAAGLVGVSKGYLSMLERGERAFSRRGLLEDLAAALGASVVDLTGQPYLPGDRASALALAALPEISVALFDVGFDDVPDGPVRAVAELAAAAKRANEQAAESRYSSAGTGLGQLITELHVHAVAAPGAERRAALAALVEACVVASCLARNLGNADLAVIASVRAQEAALRLGDPGVGGLAAMASTSALSRLGARNRAARVAAAALREVESGSGDTVRLEAAGMLHLTSAQMAAKDGRRDEAFAHLDAARDLAGRTGERNTLQFSFGPANVRAWSLSIAVELGEGPGMADRVTSRPDYDRGLSTADRRGALHFDLARANGQSGGERDLRAIHHLDTADRIAPQRLRNDPLARDLVRQLHRRSPKPSWELDSLRRRLGVEA